jgi:hypothetical protein
MQAAGELGALHTGLPGGPAESIELRGFKRVFVKRFPVPFELPFVEDRADNVTDRLHAPNEGRLVCRPDGNDLGDGLAALGDGHLFPRASHAVEQREATSLELPCRDSFLRAHGHDYVTMETQMTSQQMTGMAAG